MMRSRAMRQRSPHAQNRDEGAAAVEFALVLPILVALLLGIVQLGWYFFVANSASGAAREGARRVVVGDCWGSDTVFKNYVLKQAPTTTSATHTPTNLSAAAIGDQVTIKVVADASIVTFIPGFPSTVTREFTARLEDKEPGTGSCP